MPRIRILLAAVAAVACMAALSAAPASARSAESYMLQKVNSYRRAHGLRRVHFSRSLQGSAKKYARHLLRSGYFGHASHIHASHRFHRLGEILEWQSGLKAGVSRAFHVWLHSSGHRAIIMDPAFNYAGAGRASGRFNGRKATIWVMHFGRP